MTTIDDKDMEERLRGVVQGPQPQAPVSLHRFLRDLPEVEPVHHHGPIGRLRRVLDGLPGIAVPAPYVRRAQMAFGVAMAVVIGVGGAGFLLSLRSAPSLPAASSSPIQTGPGVTPNRSTGAHKSPVVANLGIDNITCVGLSGIDSENMALPTQAIRTPGSGEYLGVTGGAFGWVGLVRSSDGIYWDWNPPTDIDPHASLVTSIASNRRENGTPTIVVGGGVQGVDGTTDGRLWLSIDDGATWTKALNDAQFQGVPVQRVAYSLGQWIALGWTTTPAGNSARPVSAWTSVDGLNWTHVPIPIKGESALITPTAAGFLLSGTPLAAGAIDEPPIWYSTAGAAWNCAKAMDNTGQLMGPLSSATVTGLSHVAALSASPDGSSKQLVYSTDGGRTWVSVKPNDSLSNASMMSHLVSVTENSMEVLLAAIPYGEGSHIYQSMDSGTTWTRVLDTKVGGPSGTMLLEVDSGYQSLDREVLVYGEPGSGFGIWLVHVTKA